MSDNPYEVQGTPEPVAQPSSARVKGKVFPPAIALIISGALSIMGAVWGVVSWGLASAGIYPTAQQKAEQVKQIEEAFADNPQLADIFIQLMGFQESPVSLMLNVLGFLLAALVILGGVKLMNLSSYGLVLTAAIINMIPFFTCCCYGLPIGIWVLVVLLSGDVKAAFRNAGLEGFRS